MIQKRIIQFIAGTCLLFFSGHAQNTAAEISARLAQYRKKALVEKLYAHTDKNFYMAGEILWWKLYYVDGSFHKPLDLSKVAYVEVLDRNNKSVMQAKTALSQGRGSGSFYLPVSLSSGNYVFRAYTTWMKNFGADYFFEKQITIVNALKPLNPEPKAADVYDVQFFPEGGNLVRNLESKVGFRVTDQYGRGQSFTGMLLDEKNDTVLSFTPFKFGIGHFTFTPSGAHTYRAVVKMQSGEILQRTMPEIFDQGYVMNLSDSGNGTLIVTVHCNLPVSQQASLSLFVQARHVIKITAMATLVNGMARFSIDRTRLGEGISHLTVFDDKLHPICERLYFRSPEHRLSLEATSNNLQYGTRQKVNLSIKTKAPITNMSPANLSLSVYRLDSLQILDADNILSYLWLTSDLKGTVEAPQFYLSKQGPEVMEAADNLMMTHGWRRFSWDNIMQNNFTLRYVPEFDGHIIRGVIKNTATNLPAPNISSYLSVAGQQVQFYHSLSDSNGAVHFDVRDYYGQSELVLKTEEENSAINYRIELENPFYESNAVRPVPVFGLGESKQKAINKASVGMQVQNAFAGEQLSQFALPGIDSSSFYGSQGKVYKLDDYTRFTTMEEVLREYVVEIGVRKRNGQMHLMIVDFVFKGFFEGDPLILLDGVPVSHEKILNFDPLKIKKLQVIANKYIRENFVYDGVASFSTYRGALEDLQLDSKSMTLEYEGLQLRREFFSPQYETEQQINSRIPDFRSLLYWAPDVKTDSAGTAKVNFYTSDTKGRYVAVMEGMDEFGNAGSYQFTFEVTDKR